MAADTPTAELERIVAEEIGTLRLEVIKLRVLARQMEARAVAAETELAGLKIKDVKDSAIRAATMPATLIHAGHPTPNGAAPHGPDDAR